SLLFKALDNVDEIAPDVVCLSARDFPRHWKFFARYLASPVVQPHPQVILLTGSLFSDEDADQAGTLGITRIIDEAALIAGEYGSLDNFLEDGIGDTGDFGHTACMFIDPAGGGLVTGEVESRTRTSLRFQPDQVPPGYFPLGSIISDASIKTSGEVVSAQFQVAAVDSALELRLC
ncbi:MAG: hypothetical protein LBS64_02470, partial [Spirochaetaceae bacterium]|nr:hypothetical protein [Spirochaetaceae bacterium]